MLFCFLILGQEMVNLVGPFVLRADMSSIRLIQHLLIIPLGFITLLNHLRFPNLLHEHES
uniref:Uncharacterized protein n=1 Tax=Escherichia coli TaxID=562 RepID=A0A3L0W430_ECOLX